MPILISDPDQPITTAGPAPWPRLACVLSSSHEPMHPLGVELLRQAGWWVYDYRGGKVAPPGKVHQVGQWATVEQLRGPTTFHAQMALAKVEAAVAMADVTVGILPGGTGTAHLMGVARAYRNPVIGFAPGLIWWDVTLSALMLAATPDELLELVGRVRPICYRDPADLPEGWLAPIARAG